MFGEGAAGERWLDPRRWSGVLENIFYRQENVFLDAWVHCDGTIGGDIVSAEKYPEWDEIFPQYMHLAERYPFLDMVIAYTMYDECCCYFCEGVRKERFHIKRSDCKCKDCEPYLDKLAPYSEVRAGRGYSDHFDFAELYFRHWKTAHVRSDVGDSVAVTIWIHNGKTDILFGDKAADRFKEYNRMYCAPEYAFMFSDSLYRYRDTCICNKSFVEDCFEYIGKPRSLCDEYIERKFIAPFNENAIVVTKEWVIEQYNTYIAGK